MIKKGAKIYVAGHNGLVGSGIIRALKKQGYENIITKAHTELDLTDSGAVASFFQQETPEYVFVAAAKVGGILANDTFPADFIHQNLMIGHNIVHQSYLHKVNKLLFLGSSCIYPRQAPQPLKEEYFMTGMLEPTNEAYAIAKIAIIKMCQAYNKQYGTNFISVMPTNLYGPNDNFDLASSHVLPALLRKIIDARELKQPTVTIWGTGLPRREFMYVDDLADATLFLMNNYNESEIINVGTGSDVSILELAETIRKIVGYDGDIVKDTSKPDGMPRKWLDVSKLHNLGWQHSVDLAKGIKKTYEWLLENKETAFSKKH